MRFLLALLIAGSAQTVVGKTLEELTTEQKAAISRGEQVHVTEKVPHVPWPRVYIYQLVNASPKEALAVALDFELRPQFSRELKKAKISNRLSPKVTDVDYLLSVPILPDEEFTMRYAWEMSNCNVFSIRWNLVKANRTKLSLGEVQLIQTENKTLMITTTLTDPGVWGASLLAGASVKQTLDAANDMAKQIEKEKQSEQELLRRQIEAVTVADPASACH